MKRKANRFIKEMQEKKLTVAFAESVTCGLISEQLSHHAGTADVLKGAIICYSADVKMNLLGVPETIIDRYTCESMQVTEQLAKQLSLLIQADIHAAITGLAAGGGSETRQKPVGSVFICVVYKGKMYKKRSRFYGTPTDIRKKAALEMYSFILEKT